MAAGLTALELADLAGTTENRLFPIERGRFRPRADEAARLASALGVSIHDIFEPAGVQKGA